jgi:hypothetical protein
MGQFLTCIVLMWWGTTFSNSSTQTCTGFTVHTQWCSGSLNSLYLCWSQNPPDWGLLNMPSSTHIKSTKLGIDITAPFLDCWQQAIANFSQGLQYCRRAVFYEAYVFATLSNSWLSGNLFQFHPYWTPHQGPWDSEYLLIVAEEQNSRIDPRTLQPFLLCAPGIAEPPSLYC